MDCPNCGGELVNHPGANLWTCIECPNAYTDQYIHQNGQAAVPRDTVQRDLEMNGLRGLIAQENRPTIVWDEEIPPPQPTDIFNGHMTLIERNITGGG